MVDEISTLIASQSRDAMSLLTLYILETVFWQMVKTQMECSLAEFHQVLHCLVRLKPTFRDRNTE